MAYLYKACDQISEHICTFFVTFFSATVDGRDLIFGHKLHIGTPYRGKNLMGPKTLPTIWGTYMKLVTKYKISAINSCWEKICTFFVAFFSATIDDRNLIFGHKLYIGMPYCGKRFWTRQIPTSCLPTQTGSRNLMDPKTLPTIWGTYMKLVTKYQISVINSCWEKCDEKCAYMFNVYKDQLSRQTGSSNLTGPKTLPTLCVFGSIEFLLPVCRLCWFLCTLNIHVYAIVAEKNATKNVHICSMCIKTN
jgi:hypothetical protein